MAEPNGNGNGKTAHIVTGGSAAAAAMFSQWIAFSRPLETELANVKADLKAQTVLAADLQRTAADAGRVERVHAVATANTERITRLEATTVEVEQQIARLGDHANHVAQEHDRLLAVLWEKLFGNPFPHRMFYPTHGRLPGK